MSIPRGVELKRRIDKHMIGRIAGSEPEAELIEQYTKDSKIHFEIGCLWGGTSILAALSGAERIYTIDFMQGGFWDNGDPGAALRVPTAGIVLENFATFNVAHKISVYKCNSNPWPLPNWIVPDTIFIDGGHTYKAVYEDWMNVKDIVKRYVIFHDYQRAQAEVKRMIEEVVLPDDSWKLVARARSVGVFERTPNL